MCSGASDLTELTEDRQLTMWLCYWLMTFFVLMCSQSWFSLCYCVYHEFPCATVWSCKSSAHQEQLTKSTIRSIRRTWAAKLQNQPVGWPVHWMSSEVVWPSNSRCMYMPIHQSWPLVEIFKNPGWPKLYIWWGKTDAPGRGKFSYSTGSLLQLRCKIPIYSQKILQDTNVMEIHPMALFYHMKAQPVLVLDLIFRHIPHM